jgi:hypothetical protein
MSGIISFRHTVIANFIFVTQEYRPTGISKYVCFSFVSGQSHFSSLVYYLRWFSAGLQQTVLFDDIDDRSLYVLDAMILWKF